MVKDKLYLPIEWPEIIRPLLTHNVCDVTLDHRSLEERVLKLNEATFKGAS